MALPDAEPASWHVKLFVQPPKVRHFINPHTVSCQPGNNIVNSSGVPIRAPLSHPVVRDVCQINHYYYRSNQDFYEKMSKGMADSTRKHVMPERIAPPVGDTEELRAARFAPLIRRLLAEDGACAALASRLHLPETPEAAVVQIATLIGQNAVHDALVLLAKLAWRFPQHPLTNELLKQMEPLANSFEAQPL